MCEYLQVGLGKDTYNKQGMGGGLAKTKANTQKCCNITRI